MGSGPHKHKPLDDAAKKEQRQIVNTREAARARARLGRCFTIPTHFLGGIQEKKKTHQNIDSISIAYSRLVLAVHSKVYKSAADGTERPIAAATDPKFNY